MSGWIKLHRDILESKCFAHPITLKIWIWLLAKAKHKPMVILLKVGRGNIEVEIERGQLIFGRFKAEEELSIDGSTIYKHIQKLQDWGNIIIDSNNQYSVITICKYDDYQTFLGEEEQPSNNQVTTKEQPSNNQVTQIKNVKKEEEGKEDNTPKFSFRQSLINKMANEKLVSDWLEVRKTKKATNTETAFNKFLSQVEKSKQNINVVLELCITKSWSGFDAEWLKNIDGFKVSATQNGMVR